MQPFIQRMLSVEGHLSTMKFTVHHSLQCNVSPCNPAIIQAHQSSQTDYAPDKGP